MSPPAPRSRCSSPGHRWSWRRSPSPPGMRAWRPWASRSRAERAVIIGVAVPDPGRRHARGAGPGRPGARRRLSRRSRTAGSSCSALPALDPATVGPSLAWLVGPSPWSKSALGAWAVAMAARFGTRAGFATSSGWARRAPVLGVAFALTALATFGLPGWLACGPVRSRRSPVSPRGGAILACQPALLGWSRPWRPSCHTPGTGRRASARRAASGQRRAGRSGRPPQTSRSRGGAGDSGSGSGCSAGDGPPRTDRRPPHSRANHPLMVSGVVAGRLGVLRGVGLRRLGGGGLVRCVDRPARLRISAEPMASSPSVLGGEHPAVDLARVLRSSRAGTTGRARRGRLRRVRRMDQVLRGLEGEVAADRPGAASCGRVAPFIARTIAIALGPSRAAATSGPT